MEKTSFTTLSPGLIIDAVESQGFRCDCRTFALNSYENRVYQVGIEEKEPIIAKFYRPGRWSDAQILEEHEFCFELVGQGLPIVAPEVNSNGESLFHFKGFRFAVYPRKGGHAPELANFDNLLQLGRLLGRIHLIGARQTFKYRPRLDSENFGYSCAQLISGQFIPYEYKASYDALTHKLLSRIDELLNQIDDVRFIRVHGDCHIGNLLWRENNLHLVDFDDARMAPAIQDLWMLLSGEPQQQTLQLSKIIEGYSCFFDFHPRELLLIEAFRTLRMIHYSAWLGRRWNDPAFPRTFPWFNTTKYWSDHIIELREQLAALYEPPLQIDI